MRAIKSLILSTAIGYMVPILLVFSIAVLVRGHNEPGGGFVGGLVTSAAFALYAVTFGAERAGRTLRISPITLIAIGLLTTIVSGLLPMLISNQPFLTGLWSEQKFADIISVGTPTLFDIGVYLVVVGITLTIVFSLAEEDDPEEVV